MQEMEWVKTHEDKLAPRVRAALEAIESPEDKVKVIIELEDRRQYKQSRIRRAIRRLGGNIYSELPLVNSVAVELPASALKEFIPLHNPKMVWHDHEIKSCLNVAVPAIHGDLAFRRGITGRGVTVAVLDTGVDPHPDLTQPRNRIIAFRDFVNNKRGPYDDNGHGTHVSGIIAGNGRQSGEKYRGVAPEARLVCLKVLDNEGGGSASTVIEGIQWVVRNRSQFRIRVMNLSMGSKAEEGYQHDPVSRAAEAAWERGIVVCAAAGNEGPDSETIATPGICPSVITVGNMDDRETVTRTDDEIAKTSSRGPTIDNINKPDILAPGTNIVSLKNGGGYIAHSGTSMSTPMVSGAVALLLQKYPRLTPTEVKSRLLAGAENRRLPDNTQGSGYLDLTNPLGLNVVQVVGPNSGGLFNRFMNRLADIFPELFPSGAVPQLSISRNKLINAVTKVVPFMLPPEEAELFNRLTPLLRIFSDDSAEAGIREEADDMGGGPGEPVEQGGPGPAVQDMAGGVGGADIPNFNFSGGPGFTGIPGLDFNQLIDKFIGILPSLQGTFGAANAARGLGIGDMIPKILPLVQLFLGRGGEAANPWLGLISGLSQWMVNGSGSPV